MNTKLQRLRLVALLGTTLLLTACFEHRDDDRLFAVLSDDLMLVCCEGDGEVAIGSIDVEQLVPETFILNGRPAGFLVAETPPGVRAEPTEQSLDQGATGSFALFADCDALADSQEVTLRYYASRARRDAGAAPLQVETVTIAKDPDCEDDEAPPPEDEGDEPGDGRVGATAINVLHGTVANVFGDEVADATVTVRSEDGTEISTTTDEHGGFVLPGVPGGSVTFSVATLDYTSFVRRITLPPIGIHFFPTIWLAPNDGGVTVEVDVDTGRTTKEIRTSTDSARLHIPEGTTIELDGATPAGGETELVVEETDVAAAAGQISGDPAIVAAAVVGGDGHSFDTNQKATGPGGVSLEIPNRTGIPVGTFLKGWRQQEGTLEWENRGSVSVSADGAWIVARDFVLATGTFAITANYDRVTFPTAFATGRLTDVEGAPVPHTGISTNHGAWAVTDEDGRFRVEVGRIFAFGPYDWMPALTVHSRFLDRAVGDGKIELDADDFGLSEEDVDVGELTVPGLVKALTLVVRALDDGIPAKGTAVRATLDDVGADIVTDERGFGTWSPRGDLTLFPRLLTASDIATMRDETRRYGIASVTHQRVAGDGDTDVRLLVACADHHDPTRSPLAANGAVVEVTDASDRVLRGITNERGELFVTDVTLPLKRIVATQAVISGSFEGLLRVVVDGPTVTGGAVIVTLPGPPRSDSAVGDEVFAHGTAPAAPAGEERVVRIVDPATNRIVAEAPVSGTTWGTTVAAFAPADYVLTSRDGPFTRSTKVVRISDLSLDAEHDFSEPTSVVGADYDVHAPVDWYDPSRTGLSIAMGLGDGSTIRLPIELVASTAFAFASRVPDAAAIEALTGDTGTLSLELMIEKLNPQVHLSVRVLDIGTEDGFGADLNIEGRDPGTFSIDETGFAWRAGDDIPDEGAPAVARRTLDRLVEVHSFRLFRGEEFRADWLDLPRFARESVTTSVTLWSGQTAVLGGLVGPEVPHERATWPLLLTPDAVAAGRTWTWWVTVPADPAAPAHLTGLFGGFRGLHFSEPEPQDPGTSTFEFIEIRKTW